LNPEDILKKFCKTCYKEFIPISSDKEFDKITDPYTYWKKLPVTLTIPQNITEEEVLDTLYNRMKLFAHPTTFYDAFSIDSKNQIRGRINTKKLVL
jgi:hypothetical protein